MAKQTKIEELYEEVSNERLIWKPSKNDEIEGKIVRQIKGSFGMSFVLANDDGEYFLPNHVVLTSLLERCSIGSNVKIVCTGFEKSKDKSKNDTTLYMVFVKKE